MSSTIKLEEWNTMTMKNEEHTLRWQLRIENFLWYPAEPGLAIESPEFVCKTDDGSCDLKWSMTILPNGRADTEDKAGKWKNCVGVFLHLKSSPENILNVGSNFQICIVGKEGVRVKTARAAKSSTINYLNQGYGFGNLITRKELEEQHDRFLPDGCLTVECFGKLFFHSKYPTFKPQIVNIPVKNGGIEESIIKVMYEQQLNTDVILKSSDNGFKGHKCVLSARSPYFKAMFDYSMGDKEEAIVDMSKELNGREMKAFLDYVYLGKFPVGLEAESYKALSRVSDVHCFDELKRFSEEALFSKIPAEVQAIQATSFNDLDNSLDNSLEAIENAKDDQSLVPVPTDPPKKRKTSHEDKESTSKGMPAYLPQFSDRRATALPFPEQKPRLGNW